MTGFSLRDLPFDIIVNIVSFYRSLLIPLDLGLSFHRPAPHLCELSLVCRAFNDACSVFLFRNYRVEIVNMFGEGAIEDAKERISTIIRKAPYIRALEVVVCAAIEKVMQELIFAMRRAPGIVNLKLSSDPSEGSSRLLPKELVIALASGAIKPKVLQFEGEWSPPERVETINEVEELHISPLTSGNLSLTVFIKAPNLYIENDSNSFAYYKPTQNDSHLRRISIALSGFWWFADQPFWVQYPDENHDEFNYPEEEEEEGDDDAGDDDDDDDSAGYVNDSSLIHFEDPRKAFDFSQALFTDVKVQISMPSALYSDWMERRHIVEKIFTDDLTTFNVEFDSDEGTARIWRTKGAEVRHQDQLVDERRDAEGLAYDERRRGCEDESDSDSNYYYDSDFDFDCDYATSYGYGHESESDMNSPGYWRRRFED